MQNLQIIFDAAATLADIKATRALRRRRTTWGKSRLAKHRAELVKLRAEGASFGDLAVWLKSAKRIIVDRSSIKRYLDKLPEMNSTDG